MRRAKLPERCYFKLFGSMIDLRSLRQCPYLIVDGQLDDGRLVEIKANFPHGINVMRLIVAMSNSTGGLILFGIDERLTIVGIKESFKKSISILEQDIQRYSVGIRCQITHEVIDGKDVVTLIFLKSIKFLF